jgi:hypothetical protein
MLNTVLEETERSVAKVKQHTHTITLLVRACLIVSSLTVAKQ